MSKLITVVSKALWTVALIIYRMLFGFRSRPKSSPLPESMHAKHRPAFEGLLVNKWTGSIIIIVAFYYYAAPYLIREVPLAWGRIQLNWIAEPVTSEMYVAFNVSLPEEIRNKIKNQLASDYKIVKLRFDSQLPMPVIFYIEPGIINMHDGTHANGYYTNRSHKKYSFHDIHVSLSAVFDGTPRHELAHAYVDIINPFTTLMLNEGVAHLVGGSDDFDINLASGFWFPNFPHWKYDFGESMKDDHRARAFGWATAYYLHKEKGLSLKQIITLPKEDLPDEQKIRLTMRNLVSLYLLNQGIALVENSSLDDGFNIDSFERLYEEENKKISLNEAEGAVRDIRRFLTDLSWATVFYLTHDKGLSIEEIRQMPLSEFMRFSDNALRKVNEWIPEYRMAAGNKLYFDSADHFSVYSAAILRSKLNVEENSDDNSEVEKISSLRIYEAEGWAAVYYLNEISNDTFDSRDKKKMLPVVDQALLDAIIKHRGVDISIFELYLGIAENFRRAN